MKPLRSTAITLSFLFSSISFGHLPTASAATVSESGGSYCAQDVSSTAGVVVTRLGTDCVVSFQSTGSNTWTVPQGVTSINYLVVGGGGAGGSVSLGSSGGGGGGRALTGSTAISGATSFTITVGSGGSPTAVSSVNSVASGGNGGASSLVPNNASGITAIGGGGGANSRSYNLTQGVGSNTGWTGGGGSAHAGTRSLGSTGAGGSSFKGGDAWANSTQADPQAAGGGGGAGGAGGNASSGVAGNGGIGISSSITGTSLFYGGGGGGGKRTITGSAGSGGSGVGGNGGQAGVGGANGLTNRGGGGGGSGEGVDQVGGSGGSGIVIIRYAIVQETLSNAATPVLSAVNGTTDSISVSWSEVSNASSYTLKLYDSSNNLINTITDISTTSQTLTNLDPSTQYKVTVQAIGNGISYLTSAESSKATSSTNNPVTVSINRSLTNPYSSRSLNYTFTFSEDVSGLSASNITLSGTSTGWTKGSLTGSGSSYSITLTNASPQDGTINLTLDNTGIAAISSSVQPATTSATTYTLGKATQVTTWIKFLWGEDLQRF